MQGAAKYTNLEEAQVAANKLEKCTGLNERLANFYLMPDTARIGTYQDTQNIANNFNMYPRLHNMHY